jgi:hypothetical protein
MASNDFRDLDHVESWLEQFKNPEVAKRTDEATIQMIALLGQALQVIVGEVRLLKRAASSKLP